MGVVILNNAVGVDKEINAIQQCLVDNLVDENICGTPWNSDNLHIYHKAYKNPTKEEGLIPEAFTQNSTNQRDYKEVLLDDNSDSTVFFTVEDNPTILDGKRLISSVVSVFFQLNIENIYDDLDYRQVEPAHNDVMNALRQCANVKEMSAPIQTIPVVYSEFRNNNITYTDMQPFHCFRVDVTVHYEYNCNYYCQFPPSTTGGFEYILDFGLN